MPFELSKWWIREYGSDRESVARLLALDAGPYRESFLRDLATRFAVSRTRLKEILLPEEHAVGERIASASRLVLRSLPEVETEMLALIAKVWSRKFAYSMPDEAFSEEDRMDPVDLMAADLCYELWPVDLGVFEAELKNPAVLESLRGKVQHWFSGLRNLLSNLVDANLPLSTRIGVPPEVSHANGLWLAGGDMFPSPWMEMTLSSSDLSVLSPHPRYVGRWFPEVDSMQNSPGSRLLAAQPSGERALREILWSAWERVSADCLRPLEEAFRTQADSFGAAFRILSLLLPVGVNDGEFGAAFESAYLLNGWALQVAAPFQRYLGRIAPADERNLTSVESALQAIGQASELSAIPADAGSQGATTALTCFALDRLSALPEAATIRVFEGTRQSAVLSWFGARYDITSRQGDCVVQLAKSGKAKLPNRMMKELLTSVPSLAILVNQVSGTRRDNEAVFEAPALPGLFSDSPAPGDA